MDATDSKDEPVITYIYSPLMVPQRSPLPQILVSNESPSPFIMNGETIDLTAEEDEANFIGTPIADSTSTQNHHASVTHASVNHTESKPSQPLEASNPDTVHRITAKPKHPSQLQQQALRTAPDQTQSQSQRILKKTSYPSSSRFTVGPDLSRRPIEPLLTRPYQSVSSIIKDMEAEEESQLIKNDLVNRHDADRELVRAHDPPARILFPGHGTRDSIEGRKTIGNCNEVVTIISPMVLSPTVPYSGKDARANPLGNIISTRTGPFFKPFGATAPRSLNQNRSTSDYSVTEVSPPSQLSLSGPKQPPIRESLKHEAPGPLSPFLTSSNVSRSSISTSATTHGKDLLKTTGSVNNISSSPLKGFRFPPTSAPETSGGLDDAVITLKESLQAIKDNRKRSRFIDSPVQASPQKKPRLGDPFQERVPRPALSYKGYPLPTKRLPPSPEISRLQSLSRFGVDNNQSTNGDGTTNGTDARLQTGDSTNREPATEDHIDSWKSLAQAAGLHRKGIEEQPLTEEEKRVRRNAKKAEAERIKRREDPAWREKRNRERAERRLRARASSAHPCTPLKPGPQLPRPSDTLEQPLLSKDEKREVQLQQRRERRNVSRQRKMQDLEQALKRFEAPGSSKGGKSAPNGQGPDHERQDLGDLYDVSSSDEDCHHPQPTTASARDSESPMLNAADYATTGGKGLSTKTRSLLNSSAGSSHAAHPAITSDPKLTEESASATSSISDAESEVCFAYTVTRSACPAHVDESASTPTRLTHQPGLHTLAEANALASASLVAADLEHMLSRPLHISHTEDGAGMQSWSLTCRGGVIRTAVTRMPRPPTKLPKHVRANLRFPLHVYQVVQDEGEGEVLGEEVYTQRDDANREAARVMAGLQAEWKGLGRGPLDGVERAEMEGRMMKVADGLDRVEEGLFRAEMEGGEGEGVGPMVVTVRKVRVTGPRN